MHVCVCSKIKEYIGIRDFTILQVTHIGWLIKLCPHPSTKGVTVKIKKFGHPKNCCNHPKISTRLLYCWTMCPKSADGMANSVDPDRTAPRSESDLGLHCLHRPLSENVGSLWYPNSYCYPLQELVMQPLLMWRNGQTVSLAEILSLWLFLLGIQPS